MSIQHWKYIKEVQHLHIYIPHEPEACNIIICIYSVWDFAVGGKIPLTNCPFCRGFSAMNISRFIKRCCQGSYEIYIIFFFEFSFSCSSHFSFHVYRIVLWITSE